jgi:hypothetical protein
MLSGGNKHPYDVIGPEERIGHHGGPPKRGLALLGNAPSSFLSNTARIRPMNRRGYEGQSHLMIPMQNMSMEMRMIKFTAFSLCSLCPRCFKKRLPI